MTPSGGIMNTDILAARFGLTDVSVSAPGGGSNYAVSGARIDGPNPLPNTVGTPSIVQQMTNYLASTGGAANSNALYVLSAGSNDVSFARTTYGFQTPAYFAFLAAQANTFVNAVAQLQSAGARYIVIPNLSGDFLNTSIYNGLSAAGVKFIPADQAAMIAAVKASPARFGFASVTSERCHRDSRRPQRVSRPLADIPVTASTASPRRRRHRASPISAPQTPCRPACIRTTCICRPPARRSRPIIITA